LSRADYYGLRKRVDNVFILRGRGLLWSVTFIGSGTATLFDNTTAGGPILAVFYTDPTNTKAPNMTLSYPNGLPFEIGLYLTNGQTAVYTYTGLSEIFFVV